MKYEIRNQKNICGNKLIVFNHAHRSALRIASAGALPYFSIAINTKADDL